MFAVRTCAPWYIKRWTPCWISKERTIKWWVFRMKIFNCALIKGRHFILSDIYVWWVEIKENLKLHSRIVRVWDNKCVLLKNYNSNAMLTSSNVRFRQAGLSRAASLVQHSSSSSSTGATGAILLSETNRSASFFFHSAQQFTTSPQLSHNSLGKTLHAVYSNSWIFPNKSETSVVSCNLQKSKLT